MSLIHVLAVTFIAYVLVILRHSIAWGTFKLARSLRTTGSSLDAEWSLPSLTTASHSGLINQSVIGIGIAVLCVTGQELMKRRRRGKVLDERDLGSRESWEFG